MTVLTFLQQDFNLVLDFLVVQNAIGCPVLRCVDWPAIAAILNWYAFVALPHCCEAQGVRAVIQNGEDHTQGVQEATSS